MEQQQPGTIELIDHTADVGLRVKAPSLDKVFELAAIGLMDLMTAVAEVKPQEPVQVKLQEAEVDMLLVAWLQELLYLVETREMFFGKFAVRVTDNGLQATAWGEPIDPQRHPPKIEVKAVTYHGLRVVRQGDLWEAEIIFDI